MIVIRDPKTFCFNFNRLKDVDKSVKHEIEFIIKSNESYEVKLDLRSSNKHDYFN